MNTVILVVCTLTIIVSLTFGIIGIYNQFGRLTRAVEDLQRRIQEKEHD